MVEAAAGAPSLSGASIPVNMTGPEVGAQRGLPHGKSVQTTAEAAGCSAVERPVAHTGAAA